MLSRVTTKAELRSQQLDMKKGRGIKAERSPSREENRKDCPVEEVGKLTWQCNIRETSVIRVSLENLLYIYYML